MVNKLKKKKTPSTTALVNKILQVEADAQGLSLAEFKKKRDAVIKSQEEYKNRPRRQAKTINFSWFF